MYLENKPGDVRSALIVCHLTPSLCLSTFEVNKNNDIVVQAIFDLIIEGSKSKGFILVMMLFGCKFLRMRVGSIA